MSMLGKAKPLLFLQKKYAILLHAQNVEMRYDVQGYGIVLLLVNKSLLTMYRLEEPSSRRTVMMICSNSKYHGKHTGTL
jgi:hypothetical protein